MTDIHGRPRAASPILLVDDRPENLLALEAALEPLAVQVTTAPSRDEALRQLLRKDFALILLDVQTPGLDGFDTARMIKEHPRTAHIPVIFLTAFDERLDSAGKGYGCGAVDYLTKPLDPWVLRSKVQVFLDLHQKSALLGQQAQQLAAAQRIAQLGSWEVDLASGRITGSEQFHRIFELPRDQPLPEAKQLFAKVRLANGEAAALLCSTRQVNVEAELVLPSGARRRLVINAEPIPDEPGATARVIGTMQDVTQQWEATRALAQATSALEQERQLVDRLQQAVAPLELPQLPELDIAHRYRPAEPGLVGGDWFDVLQLPDGRVLLVIGDVAGHGLAAAATMSQIRTALRVLALHQTEPAALLAEVDRYLTTSPAAAFATMMVARLDPSDGACTMASAGQLPLLECDATGGAGLRWLPIGPPLGAGQGHVYRSTAFSLPPGNTLLLFTDGLIERRGEIADDGLTRLCAAVKQPFGTSTSLAEHVMEELCAVSEPSDDIALLVVRRRPLSPELRLCLPAEPAELAPLRLTMRRWLVAFDLSPEVAADIVLAVSELVTNVCLHAYRRFMAGVVRVDGTFDKGVVRFDISDEGRWRTKPSTSGGRGLDLIRALGFELSLQAGELGTTATISMRVAPDAT